MCRQIGYFRRIIQKKGPIQEKSLVGKYRYRHNRNESIGVFPIAYLFLVGSLIDDLSQDPIYSAKEIYKKPEEYMY